MSLTHVLTYLLFAYGLRDQLWTCLSDPEDTESELCVAWLIWFVLLWAFGQDDVFFVYVV